MQQCSGHQRKAGAIAAAARCIPAQKLLQGVAALPCPVGCACWRRSCRRLLRCWRCAGDTAGRRRLLLGPLLLLLLLLEEGWRQQGRSTGGGCWLSRHAGAVGHRHW